MLYSKHLSTSGLRLYNTYIIPCHLLMKCLLGLLISSSAAFTAHAQLLPVPGSKNPDWVLEKAQEKPEQAVTSTEPMPNALKSISSSSTTHRHWDATRQLAYEWESRPNSGSVAPDRSVLVREDRTGTTYVFRRRQPTPTK
jgi:hypothetical protein